MYNVSLKVGKMDDKVVQVISNSTSAGLVNINWH